MLLSSQNTVFRVDPNNIKEMQINWEKLIIIRDKTFHVKIKLFLMTCLFHLILTCLLDLVTKMFCSVYFCYKNYKRERGTTSLKTLSLN